MVTCTVSAVTKGNIESTVSSKPYSLMGGNFCWYIYVHDCKKVFSVTTSDIIVGGRVGD